MAFEEPQSKQDGHDSLPVAQEVGIPDSPYAPTQPPIPPITNQFRITTLLSWTAVACVLFASLDIRKIVDPYGVTMLAFFFAPPLTCIPVLIDHLLKKHNGLVFTLFWRIWMTFGVCVYSIVMLMLATIAFAPDWKGSKGTHWLYYLLDGWAGTTLWPIYFVGAILFAVAVNNPEKPRRSVIYLLAATTCTAISFWYVFAATFMKFVPNEPTMLTLVPGATGVCYAIYCAIILREREFTWGDTRAQGRAVIAWLGALAISICVKYPLAVRLYNHLPSNPPEDCFVVTAATRGHCRVVGTWYDAKQNRLLNQQLLTFWEFENWLKIRFPQTHRLIRLIYDRVGPLFARLIIFRWQADCVYVLLKPLEWLARGLASSKIHGRLDC